MSTRKLLMVILGLGLFVRVMLILWFRTYVHPVGWEYELIANNILTGQGFVHPFLGTTYRSLTTPLYVYLCVVVYMLTHHSYFAVLLMQALFSLLLAVIVFRIAKHMCDEQVGLIAAAMVCFHPGYLYYDVFNLIPLSIDACVIAAVAFLLIRFRERLTPAVAAGIGVLIGIGTLSRGIIGALLPFLGLYMLVCVRRPSLVRRIALIVLCGIMVMLVVAPWVIRNYSIHREFVFISSTSGENIWRGNNERALGTSLTGDGKAIFDLWPPSFRDKVFAMNELEQKKFFEHEARDFIRKNPKKALKLYLDKLRYFWWFSPQSGSIYPGSYLAVYRVFYSVFMIFVLFGVALSFSGISGIARADSVVLVFIIAAVCLTQSVFYVEGRHRWLIEPLLAVYFSYGAAVAGRSIAKRRWCVS